MNKTMFILCLIMGSLPLGSNVFYALEESVQQEPVPEYLYKIVSIDQWDKSSKGDTVIPGTIDVGFIHLSKEDQYEHVLKKFWDGQDYVLLKLSTRELQGRLVYETNPGGSVKYYHLYNGKIPLSSVVEIKIVKKAKT